MKEVYKDFLTFKNKNANVWCFFNIYLIFESSEKQDERRQDLPDFSVSDSD